MKCSITFKGHIEVPTILLFFAYMSANSVSTNIAIYRTCYVTLGYNETQCELLGKNYTSNITTALEKEVQPYVTLIFICQSIIAAIIPPLLCLFLGPWTDKYGRRPLLLTTIGGCILSFLTITAISAIPYASPWYFLLFLVPMCLTGGIPALLTAMIAYITDVTTEEYRGIRIGVFEGMIALGTIIGTSSSSFILDAWGYVTLYALGTLCVILAWIYTYFLIPESVANVETEGKFRNLFNYSLVIETFRTTFGPRENYNRALLLTLIAVMIVSVFASFGDSSVLFLYLRQRFHWTLERYTLYSSINNVTGVLGAIGGIIILYKLLHIKEAVVTLLGFLSILIGSLLQGFGTSNWVIYLAAASKCLGTATSPLTRSMLSKLIPVQDSGKVFSVVTSIETVSALVGSSLYTYLYNGTLNSFPQAFSFVSAGFYVFEVIAMGVIVVIRRRQIQYNNMREECESDA